MVRVLELKFLIESWLDDRTKFFYRMKSHWKNVKSNYERFEKNWDKEILGMLSQEENFKDYGLESGLKLNDHMAGLGTEVKKGIFKVIYNLKLVQFLQKRYKDRDDSKNSSRKYHFKVSSTRKIPTSTALGQTALSRLASHVNSNSKDPVPILVSEKLEIGGQGNKP